MYDRKQKLMRGRSKKNMICSLSTEAQIIANTLEKDRSLLQAFALANI